MFVRLPAERVSFYSSDNSPTVKQKRVMVINKAPPFKGLNIRIPILIPINGTGFIN